MSFLKPSSMKHETSYIGVYVVKAESNFLFFVLLPVLLSFSSIHIESYDIWGEALNLLRTGIAYISNVAVRRRHRRKGIARRLIAKAEALARSWGCHAITLHCEANNQAAMQLYLGQGFRSINIPEGAKWPKPRTSPEIQFNFMMKLL